MLSYAEQQAVPYMLAADDVDLTCSMVGSFTPFLLSFSQVTTPPDQLAILLYLMSGNCTEFKAQEHELRYLRALYAKNPTVAQDARIAQQRLQRLAASRQLEGYHYLTKAFKEPGGECPLLPSDKEQLYWMMGLINGLQAILNDVASGGLADVPMSIAAKVGRGANCLNNEKWWGVPNAIQAAIWMTVPGAPPTGKNPTYIMEQAMQSAQTQGVALAHVLAAQVYSGRGDAQQVKLIIRHFTKVSVTAASDVYKSLNQVSLLQIQAMSDKLWTEATGSRTPIGQLGSFWDDPKTAVETIDIDELL